MKKGIISIVLLGSIGVKSQTSNELKNTFVNNIKSPQVTDFIRYGNIPIKKYVGELDLNIPLLSVPTQDGHTVDISLAYNASGFIPSKKSGIVGLNWNLMTGGVITREVKGEADDQMGSPQTLNGINGHYEHGYLAGIKQFGSNTGQLPTDNDISTLNPSKIAAAIDNMNDEFYEIRLKGYPDNNTTRYETTPDMFSFNFNGISGKFFIAPNGTVEVTTTEPHKLKVDLSGVSSQPYVSVCAPKYQSEIIITDEKGNKYYFGKESKNLEYTVFLGTSSTGGPSRTPVINSWNLYKMEFSNGETIKYNYMYDKIDITGNNSSTFCYSNQSLIWGHGNLAQYVEMKKLLDFNIHVNDYAKMIDTDQQSWGMVYTHFTASYAQGYGNVFSIIKKTLLSDIEYKGTKIKFVYTDQDNLYKNTQVIDVNNSDTPFRSPPQKKLDKIEVYYENNLVNDVNLTYDIYNTQYPRIFLKTIKERGKQPYSFSYDTAGSANTPTPNTCALDFWGYYNGKLSNDPNFSTPKLVPGVDYYNNGDFQYTTDVRDPDFDFAKMYSLTHVTYPTGGSSFFEYEPHQYSLRLERRSNNSFVPKLYNVNSVAGGTRIKKIYDSDSGTNQNVREFFYNDDNSLSSGILMDWPRYFFKMRRQITNTSVFPVAVDETVGFMASSGYSKNLFEGAVINYSKVTEKITNKGSVVDYYTSYINKPDHYINFNDQSALLTDGTYTPLPSVRNIFMMPYDTSSERGKIYKKLIKDENNNLLEETNVLYNEDIDRFNKYHVSVNISNAWWQRLRTYYYNDFISSSTKKEYLNNQILQTETKYDYENPIHNMLTKIRTYFPDGAIQQNSYQYAQEKGNQLMIDKNMTGISLETESKRTSAGVTKTLSKTETVYPKTIAEITNNSSNFVLPLSVKSYDLSNLTNLPSTEVTYDQYDNKRNLKQYTTKDGISTTLIWGYNQTQPIAKIEGAKLSDISTSLIDAIVSASAADNAAVPLSDESAFLIVLDDFRKDSSLSGFQVTTYTYDPLIGVRSITPPSGIREVYIYDVSNRLKEIRENGSTGKLLKEFKYNYKN